MTRDKGATMKSTTITFLYSKTMRISATAALALGLGGSLAAQPSSKPRPPAAQPSSKPRPPAPMGLLSYSEGGSYLGVEVEEITAERVTALKLKEERGVEITMVDQDAPAGKAGLKEHDVILDFNGTRVEGQQQLGRLIRETPAGRSVTLGISRDGLPMQIKATLGDRMKDKAFKYGHIQMPPMPAMPSFPDIEVPAFDVVVRAYDRSTGMLVDSLTPQLGEFFGLKSGEGVLVRSVEKGSAAEAAGIKAGDVIVKLDDEKITDRNDWRRAVRDKSGKVSLGLVRDKKEQTVALTLPERRKGELRKPGPQEMFENGDEFNFDMDMDFDVDVDVSDVAPMVEHLQNSMPPVRRQLLGLEALIEEMQAGGMQIREMMEQHRGELEKQLQEMKRELRTLQPKLEGQQARSRQI